MLIARAPVRVSLAGGGTDLPAYYERYGGMVVNATIDKYFYVFVNVADGDGLQITSSDYRTFCRYDEHGTPLWDSGLRLPLAILDHFGITRGLSMFLASQIPPETGLGSSSTVAVAIIKALVAAQGLTLARQELAELACTIEIEKLGQPIGKQDQYAAACGGLNVITFTRDGVMVEPLRVSHEVWHRLQENLLLFFVGSARDAADILSQQQRASQHGDPRVIQALHRVKEMAAQVRECLEGGDLQCFGRLLHENWEQKKRFARGISTPLIDRCYDSALEHGALGGKVAGAGGGGFLMLYCEPEHRPAVTQALQAQGLKRMDFRFETTGARVLMNAGLRLRVEESGSRNCEEKRPRNTDL